MKKYLLLSILTVCLHSRLFPQGSWNPPGLDPSFPRILADSVTIPAIRASLTDPDLLPLYAAIWNNAISAIPAGNTTDSDRWIRSFLAREAAFVYLMDRNCAGGTINPLSQPERDFFLNRAITLLGEINTTVEVGTFLTFYNPWQSRSKELISYLVAYDLLKGAGVAQSLLETAKTNLLTFTANLYQRAMATYTFLNLKFFTYQFNNHSIMTASALGLAAVVFHENTSSNANYQPLNWINAGLYNIDNTLWVENGTYPRVSEPDTLAGYAESPGYFKYAFENAFPFIRSMWNFLPDGNYTVTFNGNTRSIRNPWYDTRYDRLYDWMNRIRMPDGSAPDIHDSYLGFGTVIMALSGKPQFNLPNPGFTADDPNIRTQYICTGVAHGTITDSLFQALPAAGSLVFRSSWGTSAVYMHFIGKHGIALTGAKAHHQGDASSFSLAAYGELLAVDPGYPGASQAELENKAADHSLILVNGAGPLPPTGEYVSTSTNTAYIEHCFDTPLLDYGEVRTNYQGADVIRKNLFVRNSYFLLADQVSSSGSKNYTFQLHGNGLLGASSAAATGAFIPDFSNERGVYARASVSLMADITAAGGASGYTCETDSMVIAGGFRRYSKMLVQKNGVQATVFLSALYPYTSVPPQIFPACRGSQSAGVRLQQPDFNDVVFCTMNGQLQTVSADSSGMGIPVKGDGKINFLSQTAGGEFASAFMQSGDSLVAGSQVIFKGNRRLDISFMKMDSLVSAGYISDTGTVSLYSEKPLQPIRGAVSAVSFDSAYHFATVRFTSGGNFILGPADLTWVWTGNTSTDWHDPGNWQMQDHAWVSGVPAATNNVILPAATERMPVISSAAPATCHDLTIAGGASLTVNDLKFLTVEGTLSIEGSNTP